MNSALSRLVWWRWTSLLVCLHSNTEKMNRVQNESANCWKTFCSPAAAKESKKSPDPDLLCSGLCVCRLFSAETWAQQNDESAFFCRLNWSGLIMWVTSDPCSTECEGCSRISGFVYQLTWKDLVQFVVLGSELRTQKPQSTRLRPLLSSLDYWELRT